MVRNLCTFTVFFGTALYLIAQAPEKSSALNSREKAPVASNEQMRSTYVLGPDDAIVIHAVEAEEINGKPLRIDMTGNIRLPLVGRVRASGLTVEQFENELIERLKTYIKDPQVSVNVTEFRSQPVSIIGAVATPGVHQLQGKKTLVEMISMAGGLKEEAGPTIKLTRQLKWGQIPLANAKDDPTGQVSTAEISVKDIMEGTNPLENILIRPEDVITVPRAQMVYLIGEVQKPGGYVLRERQSVSVLQALSLAGGPSRNAGKKNAKILRLVAGNPERTEIPINLQKVLSGQGNDVALLPEDILFVPNNLSKNIAIRTMEAALTIGTGMAVYRF